MFKEFLNNLKVRAIANKYPIGLTIACIILVAIIARSC